MFSPKPTSIPHPPLPRLPASVCVKVSERGRVSEGGLRAQAITHSPLPAKVLLVSMAKTDEV